MAGFLERVFQDYDYIKTHRPSRLEPLAPASTPPIKPDDPPPWVSPEAPAATPAIKPDDPPPVDPMSSKDTGGFAKVMGAGLAIRGIQSQAAQAVNYNALRSAPEFEALAEPLLGEAAVTSVAEGVALGAAELVPGIALGAMGVSVVDQLMRNEYRNSAVKPGEVTFVVDGKAVPAKTFHEAPPEARVKIEAPTFAADETGLDRAYENPQGTFYDPSTKTLYVKGSVTATDWVDDARDIPFGDTERAERYRQAMDAYKELKSQGKDVGRIVGHSLGGAVALTMQKNLKIPESRTFGAPVMDFNVFGHSERYRHPLDPVSAADRGATWGPWMGVNPLSTHSYRGFGGLQK